MLDLTRKQYTVYKTPVDYKHFAGKATDYNEEGKKSFTIRIPEDLAKELIEGRVSGVSKNEDEDYFRLKININYHYNNDGSPWSINPVAFFKSSSNDIRQPVDEAGLANADYHYIDYVDTTFTIGHWQRSGREGWSAYLKTLIVTFKEKPQDEDPLLKGYESGPSNDEGLPFN